MFGTQVKLRTVFHSQADGQEDLTSGRYSKGIWNNPLSFIEFSSNNSYHMIISMEPFDAIYGR